MRIGNTTKPTNVTDATRPRTYGSDGRSGAPAPREVRDTASVMGIPAGELSPKAQSAITRLMAEIEALQNTVKSQQARIAYLEQLADQDSLTPVANRRAFVRELSRITSFGERYGATSSVIYFDLNGLKEINDTYGHAAGDAAIGKVADILLEHVRESDLVGRLGGDEFGVLLSQADEATARTKAKTLIDEIESAPLDWQGHQIPLRLAYGTHTFSTGENAGDALAAADRAMYAHKRGG